MTAPRILFVTRKWAPAIGGMETYSHRLSEELAEIEPVEVVALPGRADGSPPSAAALLGFPFTVLRRWFARDTVPDVLHLGDMAIWPLGLLAKLFAPGRQVVLSAHGTDVSYPARGGFLGKAYGAYQRLGARLLGLRATVVANSDTTAEAARGLGWQVAAIVPLGTDLRAPQEPAHHTDEILFAGRLVTRKGCGWFVREVLPLLPERFTLAVAGTGWAEDEAFVTRHPRVRFLGGLGQAELARAYGRALCVIVPNIELANGEFEGFGLVAPEAAACGGVVLAARTGGLTSAVRDGETGFLLPPGDAAGWKAQIEIVAAWSEAQRSDFTRNAAKVATEHYSWPRAARETFAVYALPSPAFQA